MGSPRCFLHAFMQCRSWVAVGGEFAVPDGVLALLAAIIHRAQGAVGLQYKSILAGLFELGEVDAQIQHAISGNLGSDHFAFIGGVAEVAPVYDPVIGSNLIGKHSTFAPVGSNRAVQRPGSNQSPCACRLGDRVRGRVGREYQGEKNSQRRSTKRPTQVWRPRFSWMIRYRSLAFRFLRANAPALVPGGLRKAGTRRIIPA